MNKEFKIDSKIVSLIAAELHVKDKQVMALGELFASEATIPFIARYRKEATGGLDEVVIQQAKLRFEFYAELEKRRAYILKSLEDRELQTPELQNAILQTYSATDLEDIFLPYKPKRRTRATIAREKGLEPLAELILKQQQNTDLEQEAVKFVSLEKDVPDIAAALAGAGDIIAEFISEDKEVRKRLRELFAVEAELSSVLIKKNIDKGEKFKDYFDWNEKASSSPSHRVLALFRGENAGVLKLRIRPAEAKALRIMQLYLIRKNCSCTEYFSAVITDSYDRLIAPSLENELRGELKQLADNEAVKVFAQNLRELLMAPPLGNRAVLAIDPGIRTGCKLVALNEYGDLLDNTVVFIDRKQNEAEKIIRQWVEKYRSTAIAIGNGTYGRESEKFVRSLKIAEVDVIMVSESGASVYSASETAREEFPDYDLTVRGAVSIGRRLLDPLAELVKIDPKSIGVGQYQHDVDQKLLKDGLDSVVMSCVNAVGVELNTASKELLTYVSGIGEKIAENIIKYRSGNGEFKSRKDILKVPRLGAKAYEQAAGFIRVNNSANPLDRSAVHPESYGIVEKMARDSRCTVADLLDNQQLRAGIVLEDYITEKAGLPTLEDIMRELARPGRDPRAEFKLFAFSNDVNNIGDLNEGMVLPGIVTNVTNFGAFVDIGVHQDGLVHISQLADKYVADPNSIVKVQQQVQVRVLEVDQKRKRISLSMKKK